MKNYKYVILTAAIILPVILLYFYYAHYSATDSIWINECTLHRFTGLECPGCGGQRSLHLLLHGEILQALHYNAFFVIALPFLAYFYYMAIRVYVLGQKEYLKSFIFRPWFGISLIVFVVLFFILRNIPIFPFTYLAPPQ